MKRILWIDDKIDDELMEYANACFSKEEFKIDFIKPADSSKLECNYDLIILDLIYGSSARSSSGYASAKKGLDKLGFIKSKCKKIKIVVVSVMQNDEIYNECKKLGANCYIVKYPALEIFYKAVLDTLNDNKYRVIKLS